MDKKAIAILLKTIKTSQSKSLGSWFYWETYMNYISEEDFNYAKQHMTMFDQEKIDHNEIFKRIKKAFLKIRKEDVVDAFLYSLSTRKLEYRSFLSSYCIAKTITEHEFIPSPNPNSNICAICGLRINEFEKSIEFNIINYFKFKYGSCSDNSIGVLFDLEIFPYFSVVKPTEEDYNILNEIKKSITLSEPNDRISNLKKKISIVIKSNDEERLGILEILGVIGILHDDIHFGYADNYVTYLEREHRSVRFDDVSYPARWWQGKDGVDEGKWDYWFKNKDID